MVSKIYKDIFRLRNILYPEKIATTPTITHKTNMPPRRKQSRAQSRAETGGEIIALRIVENTREQYGSTISRVVRYLTVHHPGWTEGGSVKLPLSEEAWMVILMYLSVKRTRAGVEISPRKYNQFPTIASIISALKFLHDEKDIAIDNKVYKMLSGNRMSYIM